LGHSQVHLDYKGRECDGPDCHYVHGERLEPEEGKSKGKKIRLEYCTGCYDKMYCSKKCHRAHWAEHKPICQEIQRERREKEDRKKIEREAAAAASFVPASIVPQAGSSKKKKGKGGGAKKKKGKK
jgi:hypothetical protein